MEVENMNMASRLFKKKEDLIKYLSEENGFYLPDTPKFNQIRWMQQLLVGQKKCLKTSEVTTIREPPMMRGLSLTDLAEWMIQRGHGEYLPCRQSKSLYT